MSRPLNIAVVGLGFMGVTHLKAWRQIPSVRLHAVVDADPRKLTGDLSAVAGNLGSGGEQFDFSDVRGYRLLDEALADPAIDAVDICLPTDEHAPAATAALRAGKHVLTEKPMALDAPTAEALIREAERSGRLLMAAHVLRFFPAYETLAESLRAGDPVRSALFRRRCAAPVWSAWLKDPARSGGGIMDLLIHDADFCISLWGMPDAVHARGYRDLTRGIDVIHADLVYPDLGAVIITGGAGIIPATIRSPWNSPSPPTLPLSIGRAAQTTFAFTRPKAIRVRSSCPKKTPSPPNWPISPTAPSGIVSRIAAPLPNPPRPLP